MIVSNMRLDDSAAIVQGNERVIRPRLADARFFFETDKKTKLADRVPQLESIVYHNKLGTQAQRVQRLRKLAVAIQETLPRGKAGKEYADRAACLAKADLVTLMVGEFPELQGVMGRYYALHDGEASEVADAIRDHYKPQGPSDSIPVSKAGQAIALADAIVLRHELQLGVVLGHVDAAEVGVRPSHRAGGMVLLGGSVVIGGDRGSGADSGK